MKFWKIEAGICHFYKQNACSRILDMLRSKLYEKSIIEIAFHISYPRTSFGVSTRDCD